MIRFDPDADAPEDQFTIKEVVWSAELAAAEVERLNHLNAAKGCRYFAQVTRLFPPRAAAGGRTSEHSA